MTVVAGATKMLDVGSSFCRKTVPVELLIVVAAQIFSTGSHIASQGELKVSIRMAAQISG
ncbi:hypothetical protein [Paraburkholderia haematera]|uniref:hypothetical protein n=1 Tax=Paraburkholderia haematera TaxID=2793077 RepID=UPI001B8DA255|nr:hypothetical protein [Paraburkholderia haematera]